MKNNKVNLYYFNMENLNINNSLLSLYGVKKVKELAKEKWNLKEDPQIGREPLGKPFFINYSNYHFNISHSEKHLIIALSSSNLGVDIEKIRSFNQRIYERFFLQEEQEYIMMAENNEVLEKRFFEIWTMKEAYVKYTGEGLRKSFKSFNVFNPKFKKFFRCIKYDGCCISVYSYKKNTKISIFFKGKIDFKDEHYIDNI